MYNHAYACLFESAPPCICETSEPEIFPSDQLPGVWTEEELARIRIVLRRLTAIRIENPADAEDIVQDTLLTLVKKAPHVDLEKGLAIWAMGILRNKVGNYYRRTQRFLPLETLESSGQRRSGGREMAPSPESSLHHSELCGMIEDALKRLPERDREALDLYLSGLEAGEIAIRLRPERYQNILNRLYRGRKKLARELARRGYHKNPPAIR